MKKKFLKIIIAVAVAAAIITGGYYGYKKLVPSKQVTSQQTYITQTAKMMKIDVKIQGTGAVFADDSKDVSPNNAGEIRNLNVNVGDTVKKGQALFTTYSDDVVNSLSKAQTNLQKQQLTLANAKSDNEIAMDNFAVTDAQNSVYQAQKAVNNMQVTSPIDGVVVAKNFSSGDNGDQGKAVLTVVNMNSLRVKVAVDELDIAKVKVGQTAEIQVGAIKDKTFQGQVISVAQTGTSSNNVTTYDVVVSITNPADIKLGMNANVSIVADSKDSALVIPQEAVIDRNGQKYVMIPTSSTATGSTTSSGTNNSNWSSQNSQGNQQNSSNSTSSGTSTNQSGRTRNRTGAQGSYSGSGFAGVGYSGGGKLVQITIGLENENYVEVLTGLKTGDKVMIALPQVSSSTSSQKSSLGGNSGFGGMGSFGGSSNYGGSRTSQGSGNKN